jgi:5'-methylthioadenosine phosphorylase
MAAAVLGIIGGSGLYDLPGLEDVDDRQIATPWGEPSDALRFGRVGATRVVFLPRHGRGHRIAPSGINYRANIDALKRAGVTDLVSFSACGSFREDLPPGTFVLVDDFVDRTLRREGSFFGTGCVAHVPFAHPVSPALADLVERAAREERIPHRRGGTAVCMEGPQFSTLAESKTYRALGYDVVHMTSMPEAKLAREAEISYALVAMVTDFDCWHPSHDKVDVASVLRVMHDNRDKALRLFARLARDFPAEHPPCPVGSDRALDGAILTAPEARDPAVLARLDAVAGRVLAGG